MSPLSFDSPVSALASKNCPPLSHPSQSDQVPLLLGAYAQRFHPYYTLQIEGTLTNVFQNLLYFLT